MEQTELLLVSFSCWGEGELYVEVVCMECQRGDYARGNRGRAGQGAAGRGGYI